MFEYADSFSDLLFKKMHPNAPFFWNMIFLIGAWSMMLGFVWIFEKYTRSLRVRIRIEKKQRTPFIVSRKTQEKWDDLGERQILFFARIGRKFWSFGLIVMPFGILIGLWRAFIWPYL